MVFKASSPAAPMSRVLALAVSLRQFHPVTTSMERPTSPKQRPRGPAVDARHPESWYRYYAGYSPEFVTDVISYLSKHGHVGGDAILADPWNGAGTTTQVAEDVGVRSWGGDVNPAMVVVAKARLLGGHARPSELAICDNLISSAKRTWRSHEVDGDPLCTWFTPRGGAAIRAIEHEIASLLDPFAKGSSPLQAGTRVSTMSPLAAFFYLGLFRTTRALVAPFATSNPTWIRRPASVHERRRPSIDTVAKRFRDEILLMTGSRTTVCKDSAVDQERWYARTDAGFDQASDRAVQGAKQLATIELASSTALPLDDASVNAVLSSPPYCTRIDYAVATAPELATLGLNEIAFRALRDRMIGTSTIVGDGLAIDSSWGKTCKRFLGKVKRHPSKASDSYYLKNHKQYFAGLAHSLVEIGRILKRDAPCVLVVQDSYYKELHNDLPTIVGEMGGELGWRLRERHDYTPSQIMASVHKTATRYRSRATATESVLVFERGVR